MKRNIFSSSFILCFASFQFRFCVWKLLPLSFLHRWLWIVNITMAHDVPFSFIRRNTLTTFFASFYHHFRSYTFFGCSCCCCFYTFLLFFSFILKTLILWKCHWKYYYYYPFCECFLAVLSFFIIFVYIFPSSTSCSFFFAQNVIEIQNFPSLITLVTGNYAFVSNFFFSRAFFVSCSEKWRRWKMRGRRIKQRGRILKIILYNLNST